jgi:hypothetical protein
MNLKNLALVALAGTIMVGGTAFAQGSKPKTPATTASATDNGGKKMMKHKKHAHKARAAKKASTDTSK